MKLEYSCSDYSYSWNKKPNDYKYIFDINNNEVVFSNNINKTETKIKNIELYERDEMLFYINKIKNLNFSNIEFEIYDNDWERGTYEYFLILDSNKKIKFGEAGNSDWESDNIDIQNLVKLIDKYVKKIIQIK